jgi:hypothetical protein
MGREERQYSGSVAPIVIVGLGVAFSVGGMLIPVTGSMVFGTGNITSDACAGTAAGFFVGIIFGFVVCLVVSTAPSDLANRDSHGPQLVGEKCILCKKEIGNIAEGEFCRQCRRPAHHRCMQVESKDDDAHCPRCGAPLPAPEIE